jgi:putative transposase
VPIFSPLFRNAAIVGSQEAHHRTRSFQEEYRDFLRKYGVEFDERYVWD